MDPIAHTLVGATLARTRLGRGVPLATTTLVIAANLPDVDVAAYFWGSDVALGFRRGLTHGPLGLLLLPPLLVLVLAAWQRWRDPSTPAPFAQLTVLAYLGALTHPALDWLNTYGVRLLMPFDDRWFYGDVLFIVDPWFWLILGAGLYLDRPPESTSRHRWSWRIVAGLATLAVLAAPLGRAVQGTWVAVVVVVALARRRSAVAPTRPGRIAAAALTLLLLYLLGSLAVHRAVLQQVAGQTRQLGLAPRELFVGPLPGTPWRRDVLLVSDEEYRHGEATVSASGLKLHPEALPRLPARELDDLRPGHPELAGFLGWVRYPWTAQAATPDEPTAEAPQWLLDARYVRQLPDPPQAAPIGVARIRSR
ncbi:MAG: metal-dependent hydrolase [Acidobacteria bacterium]|nr:MAG: metal-dependent hydrolase [Acidobacteriota bacterium]REJ99467.1 MAG: metal-dependent hydrolase [Acidobacteriota bacterium]